MLLVSVQFEPESDYGGEVFAQVASAASQI